MSTFGQCLFYGTPQELLDILIQFGRAGACESAFAPELRQANDNDWCVSYCAILRILILVSFIVVFGAFLFAINILCNISRVILGCPSRAQQEPLLPTRNAPSQSTSAQGRPPQSTNSQGAMPQSKAPKTTVSPSAQRQWVTCYHNDAGGGCPTTDTIDAEIISTGCVGPGWPSNLPTIRVRAPRGLDVFVPDSWVLC